MSPSLNFFTSRPDFHDAPDNFVTGDAGIVRSAPLIARHVQVRMTNAAIENFDLHIGRRRLPALE